MIKFFRRIRRNLLSEGKTGKYIKYALGEIVLVMIGILLALQVNNWNQEHILSKQTNELLTNMLTDLKTDIERFSVDEGRMEESIAGGKFILQTKNFDSITADSLFHLLPNNVIFYRISNQTYERFKTINVTTIGGSDELFNDITAYYTYFSNFFETIVNWDSTESFEMVNFIALDDTFEAPMYSAEEFIPYAEDESLRKSALLKLMSGIKSRNLIRQAISRKVTVLSGIKDMKTKAETLVASIEEELGKK